MPPASEPGGNEGNDGNPAGEGDVKEQECDSDGKVTPQAQAAWSAISNSCVNQLAAAHGERAAPLVAATQGLADDGDSRLSANECLARAAVRRFLTQFTKSAIDAAVADCADLDLPCAAVGRRATTRSSKDEQSVVDVIFASRALAALLGSTPAALVDRKASMVSDFNAEDPLSPMALFPSSSWGQPLDGDERQRVQSLQDQVLQDVSKRGPVSIITLIALPSVTQRGGEWYVLHAIPVCIDARVAPWGDSFVVYVLVPLEIEVPEVLWPRFAHHGFPPRGREEVKPLLAQLHVAAGIRNWAEGTALGSTFVQRARCACEHFEKLANDALERAHFVPRLGAASAEKFKDENIISRAMQNLPREMRPAFSKKEFSPQAFMIVDCDPDTDFPIVYASKSFEELTAYSAEFAMGRNMRFLSPSDSALDEAFNAAERELLIEFFARKLRGHTISVVLSERRTGECFWHLVYATHIMTDPSPDSTTITRQAIGSTREKESESYALCVLTPIELQKDLLNAVLLPNGVWNHEGLAALARLRADLEEREHLIEATQNPFFSFIGDVCGHWLLEAGKDVPAFWHHSHYCPPVGAHAVVDFAGSWPELARSTLRSIIESHKIQDHVWAGAESVDQAAEDAPGCTACVVCNPNTPDCPIVFATRSWFDFTGHDPEFALGRNCRFLQPDAKIVDTCINREEAQHMKHFVRTTRHHVGDAQSFFLLNERRSGERFWNMLHMAHVEHAGKRFIIGVVTPVNLPMPLLLRHADSKVGDEERVETFAADLGDFMEHLRKLLQQRDQKNVSSLVKFITARMVNFFKLNCEDWIGDHFVPCSGKDMADAFKSNGARSWDNVLSAVGVQRLADVFGAESSDGQDVSFCLVDPSHREFPVVWVTREFENFTGYDSPWALGRNWRFMLPREELRNELLNSVEEKLLHDFCASSYASLGKDVEDTANSTDVSQSLLVNLLLGESRDGRPLWCFCAAERIILERRRYVFIAFASPEVHATRLAEVLAMDPSGLRELARLRCILRRQVRRLGAGCTLPGLARRCVEQWAASFPAAMDQRRFPLLGAGSGMEIPLIGLEVTAGSVGAISSALESGVRHVHLSFPTETSADPQLIGLEGCLLALKVAELLNWLQRHRFDYYVSSGVVFTMRTPPHLVGAFVEVHKALKSHKHPLVLWLLDATGGVKPQVLHETWVKMSEAKRAGTVATIGLYGGGEQAIDVVLRARCGRLAAYAAEVVPGRGPDVELERIYQHLGQLGAVPLAYGILGPRCSLVQSPMVVRSAHELKVDPVVPLLKWAEVQGFAAIVPTLEPRQDMALALVDEQVVEAVDPHGSLFSESIEMPAKPIYPKIHRRLVQQLQQVDATAVYTMEARLSKIEQDQNPFLLHSDRGFVVNGGADPVPLRLAPACARQALERNMEHFEQSAGAFVPGRVGEHSRAEETQHPREFFPVPLRLPPSCRPMTTGPAFLSGRLRSESDVFQWASPVNTDSGVISSFRPATGATPTGTPRGSRADAFAGVQPSPRQLLPPLQEPNAGAASQDPKVGGHSQRSGADMTAAAVAQGEAAGFGGLVQAAPGQTRQAASATGLGAKKLKPLTFRVRRKRSPGRGSVASQRVL